MFFLIIIFVVGLRVRDRRHYFLDCRNGNRSSSGCLTKRRAQEKSLYGAETVTRKMLLCGRINELAFPKRACKKVCYNNMNVK